jgi:hypothetical protein
MPDAWLHPQPCARSRKHTGVVTADEAETPTFPAQWLTAYLRALPGVHDLLVTVACDTSRKLNTSPGVPGPHAFAVRKQYRTSYDIALVHRIPPHVS